VKTELTDIKPVLQALVTLLAICMFCASILLGEFLLTGYTPENNRDVFLLTIPSSGVQQLHVTHPKDFQQPQDVLWAGNITKLLICTMLTNDFSRYAAGALKIAHAIAGGKKRSSDVKTLLDIHGVQSELGILEMQVCGKQRDPCLKTLMASDKH
jgi:hypothetical protein